MSTHELPSVPPVEAGCITTQLRKQVLDAVTSLPIGDPQETQNDCKAVTNLLDQLGRKGGIKGVAVLYQPDYHILYLTVFEEDALSLTKETLAQRELMSDPDFKETHGRVVPIILEPGRVLGDLLGCDVYFDSRFTTKVPNLQPA